MSGCQGALSAVSVRQISRAAVRSFARAVLHAVDAPVAVLWPDGRLLDPNARFRELLSRLGPEAAGDAGELAAVLGPRWAAALRDCAADGRATAWEGPGELGGTLIPLRADGSRTVLVACAVREAGGVDAFARLSAGAAHEIRNPLTAMAGLLQLLGPLVPGEPGAGYLRIVREEVARLERIAGDLLLLGAPAREPPEGWRCDLGACLRSVLDLVSVRAHAQAVTLRAEVQPALPAAAADPAAVRQVLLNLVSNALDAVRPGGAVRCGARAAGAFVEATVADDGPGIPEQELPRVFEPFFTTKAGGTGLGLAVSQGIVRRAGGRITVASGPGSGTIVSVKLPPWSG